MDKVDNKTLDALIDAFEKAEKHKCPKSAHGELLIFGAVPEQHFYGEIASCLKELRNKRAVLKNIMANEETGLLTAEERAELLNNLTKMLIDKNYNLMVGGYDDTSGVLFEILLQKIHDEEGLKVEKVY